MFFKASEAMKRKRERKNVSLSDIPSVRRKFKKKLCLDKEQQAPKDSEKHNEKFIIPLIN